MKREPEIILQRILEIIDDDVTRIKIMAQDEPLSSESAFVLCRYAEVLGRTIKAENVVEEVKTKKLANMSTEELKQKAEFLLKQEGKR